jgi:hypothetical protein
MGTSAYAACPAISVADMQGVAAGAFPQQYELSEFEAAAGCSMEFSANPESDALNAEIKGNPALPSLAERLPEEPLVVVPYDSTGKYGGTLHAFEFKYSTDKKASIPKAFSSAYPEHSFTQITPGNLHQLFS